MFLELVDAKVGVMPDHALTDSDDLAISTSEAQCDLPVTHPVEQAFSSIGPTTDQTPLYTSRAGLPRASGCLLPGIERYASL